MVTAFSGLFLVTLAITYLISVISAVVARRALAMQVHALGGTPTELLRLGWSGDRFSTVFEQQLTALCPGLPTAAEHHLAYPVLHYSHAATDPAAVRPVEVAIGRYVATVSTVAWTPEVVLAESRLAQGAGVDAENHHATASCLASLALDQ